MSTEPREDPGGRRNEEPRLKRDRYADVEVLYGFLRRQAIMCARKLGVIVGLLASCALTIQGQQSTSRIEGTAIAYEDFIKLPAAHRVDLWGTMSPENKSVVVRTHAQRWLDRTRSRLTTGQTALVQQAIAFLTPELYRNPTDPEQVRQEAALLARLKCRLRRSDLISAFGVVDPPAPNPGWRDDLWAWFEDCSFG